MAYDLDFDELARIKLHIRKFFLYPSNWNDPNNHLTITLNWNKYAFKPENRQYIPREKGIYCFVICPSHPNFFDTKYLCYIGKTNRTLWERYKEYLNDQQGEGKPRKKIFEMLNLYKDCLFFYYATIGNSSDVNICEDTLINTFIPPINAQIPDAKLKNELKYIYE